MASLSFMIWLVAYVMVVALLVQEKPSSAHAHDLGKLRNKEWLKFFTTMSSTIEKQPILRKDVSLDGIIAYRAGGRHEEAAWGRKMLMYHAFSNKVVKQKQMSYGRASKISGNAKFDSMDTPHMNAQVNNVHTFENTPNAHGTVRFLQPKVASTKGIFRKQRLEKEHHKGAKKDGKYNSKEFLDAEDEVANLMRRDYIGKNGPRRNPPINNHKPTD